MMQQTSDKFPFMMYQRTAMILAAGTGTRLRPLTDSTPKALLPFRGKPMLDHVVSALKRHGFDYIVINVHHHAAQIIEHVRKNNGYGISITFSDERDRLMDTGGGILKARDLLEHRAPFLVHNVDIYSSIDLSALYAYHLEHRPVATLAVTDRITSRNFLIDSKARLCGWRNNMTGASVMVHNIAGLKAVAFSGIHVVGPELFSILQRDEPFSITQGYLDVARDHLVMAYDHSGDTWVDMALPGFHPGVES
jgi:NDP-sugar pyrophosphorylase family protein